MLILIWNQACNKTGHIIRNKEGYNLSGKTVYFECMLMSTLFFFFVMGELGYMISRALPSLSTMTLGLPSSKSDF